MLRFLFFVLLFMQYGCRDKPAAVIKETTPEFKQEVKQEIKYNDTAHLPWSIDPQDDTGYFKGKIPEPISRLEELDTTPLGISLAAMLNQQNIILLDSETLSHSVLIDQQKEIRTDTFRNKNSLLISRQYFGKAESQVVTLNGKTIIDYHWDGNRNNYEMVMDFNEKSFRHFSFYGKEYYYINANEAYSSGGSANNVFYHFIFNKQGKTLATFLTCRFWKMLAGDINGDQYLDYLDFNNDNFCTTIPYSDDVTISLYSAAPTGEFVLQKDAAGKLWFIEAKTGQGFLQDSLNISASNWPRPLH
jgi:hypothetical protein